MVTPNQGQPLAEIEERILNWQSDLHHRWKIERALRWWTVVFGLILIFIMLKFHFRLGKLGPLVSIFLNFLSLVPAMIIQTRLNRRTRSLEVEIDDLSAVPLLLGIATMHGKLSFDDQTRNAAKRCLAKLLPTMTVADGKSLSVDDLERLRDLFVHNDKASRIAILEFWRICGGKDELKLVQKLADQREPWEVKNELFQAAESCASAIRANLERGSASVTLLRPIDAQAENQSSLLRPAGSAAPSEENLVRPVD